MTYSLTLDDYKKSSQQVRRQRVGATTERIVEGMALLCADLGLGRIRKRPTNVIVQAGKPIYTAVAGVDFHGHLRGGRAVYLEAKHTSERRFDLKMVRHSQREELAAAHADGACAVVVVLIGPLGVHWVSVVPWSVCALALAGGDKSLSVETLETWRLPAQTPLLQARAFGEVSP